MIIKTTNNLPETSLKTFLSNTEAAGTTVFRIKNGAGFASGWGVQIGETGEEQSEILVLSGAAGSASGTVSSASKYEHPADTPVYAIKYDQVVFERSTSGTAGTATPMTNGTVTIQADHDYTQFDDTSGTPTYAYRTYFRSSGLASNSIESDWITSGGFPFYSLAKIRQRVKDKLWDANFVTDTMIDDWTNEWKDQMTNAVISVNEDYALGTADVGFGTAGLGTITTADFNQVRRVWVTYNGVDIFQSTKQNVNDFLPDQTFSSAHPYHNFRGDNIIQINPPEQGGTASLVFYRFGTTMVNDTDELPIPMRPYTQSFVDYGLAQAYAKDGKLNEFDRTMGAAVSTKFAFKTELTPRDKSGATYIDLKEDVTADDSYL